MKPIKEFFKLKNWKRILISVLTLGSAAITIGFGSKYYISQNVNKSIEYGGGLEVVVQVTSNGKNADKILTENVNKSLFDRLTGGTGLNGVSVSSEGDGKIRITKSGDLNDSQRDQFLKEITNKPVLTFTDSNLKPLFFDGTFVEDGSLDKGTPVNWIPPFATNEAKSIIQNNGRNVVELKLANQEAIKQWTSATLNISKRQNRSILMWLNILELIDLAKNKYPKDWAEARENLWNFVHVGNKPFEIITDPVTKQPNIRPNPFKKNVIDIEGRYLISVANVDGPLNSEKIVINGNFTNNQATNLANRINFGLSNYNLSVVSTHYLDSTLQNKSFLYAMIAGLLVFIAIAVFMIINYGLLGIISSFSIALYMFLVLLIFTAIKGEYSPSTLAALIIGIGISVDANVITFERLKSEVYSGDSLDKSFKTSNRLSLSSIIDANITTIIIGFILFYLGTKEVKGFGITLILSIFFTLVVMLIFTRFLATLIVGTGFFDKRLLWLGIRKAKINNPGKFTRKINNIDYLNKAKWFALGSALFILASLIVFGSIAGANQSFWTGINRSLEFSGGIDISILTQGDSFGNLTKSQAEAIQKEIIKNAQNINLIDAAKIISIHKGSLSTENYIISIKTSQVLSPEQIAQIREIAQNIRSDVSLSELQVLPSEASKIVVNALIAVAVAFVGIIAYTLIRMNWTFAIAAVIGLMHDFVIVMAFIIITRLQISTIIVAAMLSIIGLSINDTIVTFDRIKEKINNEYPNQILSKEDIKLIVNQSISDTLKRSLYTSLSTIFAVFILLTFGNATNLTFNIVMLFGISIGVYSSIFICSWIWSKLELFKQKQIQKRIESKYWDISVPDEQTFPGINDFEY
ncbi:bifunctional preprotein translocase subunit SecD/SecF [Mycoplasmopsis citelli]|uniref:Protein translocase subunit SecF n=1 Tax=Mycoplasmopsis citelli TaxID=171281 RepID=A0A449B2W5_9BACT|nr:protein translocase subunit SecDF [Mycoplasmopsis citelli]VEU74932.1 bifunctional preprotein translocase subunit SecD/SecF [Mycoplasmopsis citelli]